MEHKDLKIVTCKVKVRISMGWVFIDTSEELENEGNLAYRCGKILTILPYDPEPIETQEAEEGKTNERMHQITKMNSHIVHNLNNQIINYNKRQENLALEIKPVGDHTIKLKYLR
jgi:hypothetical protein